MIGLLVAPSLIDWTEYRTLFATRLATAVGRPVSIDGGVDFVLLPRPAFNADEVRIGGAVSDDFVGVERLSARLAFLPLLKGRVQFRELVLRRAEGRLTRNAEGKVDFLGQATVTGAAAPSDGFAPSAPVDLDVDRVLIDDSTLTYQDLINDVTVDLRGINAAIMSRPRMPTTISGTFTVGVVALELDASLDQPPPGGVRTVNAAIKLLEEDVSAKINMALTPVADHTELRGDVVVNGAQASALLAGLGIDLSGRIPGALRKPFSVAAKLHGSTADLTADVTALNIGGATAQGAVYWRAADKNILDLKLDFGAVDLTIWRFAALDAAPTVFPYFSGVLKTAHAQDVVHVPFNGFRNMEVNAHISAPILSYGEQTLRGGVIKAALSGNELTLSDVSVELPGATYVRTYGFVRFDERPVFEGAAELQSANVRAVLDWFGVNTKDIPPGRLTSASLKTAIQGTPTQFTLGDIAATIDTSGIVGRISWSVEQRPTLMVDMTVNALNLDAYRTLPEVKTVEAANKEQAVSPPGAGYGVKPQLTHFSGLADIDADVRVQIDNLTAGGAAGGKVGIDVALKDNVLNIRSASFDNVAGATAWFSGGISGFGISPRFDNVQFDFSVTDVPRLARLLEHDAPAAIRALAPVSLTGVLNGGLAEADIAATLKAAGLTVHADGTALTLDQEPHLTLNVDAAQPSYAAMIKAAGLPWPVGTPDPGAVKLSAHVSYEKATTRISDLVARVGDNAVAGNIDISVAHGKKTINGALKDVSFFYDRIWPKESKMTLAPSSPGGGGRPMALLPAAGVWSDEPFDWSILKAWRGDIQVSGTALTVRGVQARDFNFRLGLADGAAEIADWRGKIFGAPGQLYLKVAALPEHLAQGEVAFLGGDLGAIAGAINGPSNGAGAGPGGNFKSGGKVDFAGSFRMQGASPAALISDLSGSGTVKLSTTEAGTGPISALLGAVAAANQLEGLSGHKGGAVTLESRFSAAAGRIRIEDATVASKSYGGAFTGTIDLPRWQVDMSGKLRLETPDSGGRPVVAPIAVKGTLDLPNITLLPP